MGGRNVSLHAVFAAFRWPEWTALCVGAIILVFQVLTVVVIGISAGVVSAGHFLLGAGVFMVAFDVVAAAAVWLVLMAALQMGRGLHRFARHLRTSRLAVSSGEHSVRPA
ncbi:MAG: hypothetical protein GC166_09850 [Alphaproteobacteria bacterium]|nr:hypothetical protein [Alphaproteobacteria bacterium]